MLPIPEGSDILARYVQDWKSVKAGTLCIVILKGEQDFVFKKVSIEADGTVLLVSLNEQYKPYSVHINDLLEIWEFDRYISNDIPEKTTDLDELKRMISGLKDEVKRIQ
jgi:hypothetical protein